MIQTAQIQVGTSVTELTLGNGYRDEGMSLAIQAPAGATLYIGGSNVTAQNGWAVPAGQVLSIDLNRDERLYGVLDTGNANSTVFLMRTGV